MSIDNQNHNIAKIVSKELIGTITDTEEQELKFWLSESDENQKIYTKLKSDRWFISNQVLYAKFDVKKGWRQVESRIEGSGKIIALRKRIVQYVAVAASLIILLTTYLFREQVGGFLNHDEIQPIVTNNNILPGTHKATLTLADGNQLILGQKDSIQVGNAKSNGNQIVYREMDQEEEKIHLNSLTVPRGGTFLLELSDGSKVWLNAGSQVRYPVRFTKGKLRKIELVYGEIYLDVTSSKLQAGSRFAVEHSGQTVEVLGTEFNIKAYPEEPSVITTLVEGRVKVSIRNETNKLKPGQKSIWIKGAGEVFVQEADVFREVAWKEGIFSFKDTSLEEVMRVFSRWYDMDVRFESEKLKKLTFNGTLRKDQSIEDILQFLKGSINTYAINDKTLILK